MATFSLILDARIHRTILLDMELSQDTRYSIITRTDTDGTYLDITPRPSGPTKRVKCSGLFKPPFVGVKILVRGVNQFPCDLHDDQHRCLELGVELSSDSATSIIFVKSLSAGGTTSDFLLMTDNSGATQKVNVGGGTKIPPHTGIDLTVALQELTQKFQEFTQIFKDGGYSDKK